MNHKEVDHFVLLGSRKLMHARWSLYDEELVPAAGSCLSCTKRTHAQAQLFQIGDTDSNDACLDGGCWQGKVAAQSDEDLAAAFEQGQELIDPKDAKTLWTFGGGPVAGWIEEHEAKELPDDFEPELEEPYKTWAQVIGLEHPSIRVTLDRDGHARRLITQADLATALWDLGHKEAHKVMRPQHEAPQFSATADWSTSTLAAASDLAP